MPKNPSKNRGLKYLKNVIIRENDTFEDQLIFLTLTEFKRKPNLKEKYAK